MDFCKSCSHILTNQLLCLFHRLLFRHGRKGQRAKMISAKKQTRFIKMDLISKLFDKYSEICRLHSSIPAILITLIGRTFNQDTGIVFPSFQKSGFDHVFIRTAAGINSCCLSCFLRSNNFLQCIFHEFIYLLSSHARLYVR